MVWKALAWGVIGLIAGCWLSGLIVGVIGLPTFLLYLIGLGIGISAFISSYKNQGRPPTWLWRRFKKKEPTK